MGRLRAQLLDEIFDTMTIPRQVNNILADGGHISNEIALKHASALQWRFRNAATFDEMYKILHKMKHNNCSECRFYIRLILWQYCKIAPQMTVTDIEKYCMLYYERVPLNWQYVFIMGLLSGIVTSIIQSNITPCAVLCIGDDEHICM